MVRKEPPQLLPRSKRVAAAPPDGRAFRSEWIDFHRGIRVGNLEPHERITQILKLDLESRHRTPFVIDRWGRGVYWQWICWLPRANREAKPLSSDVNFGCAKLYITIDHEAQVFEAGLGVERGYTRGRAAIPGCTLQRDWDWYRLLRQCRKKGGELEGELLRLVKDEGFVARVSGTDANTSFYGKSLRSAGQIGEAARAAPRGGWLGFQLFYPISAAEVQACSGADLVAAIKGAFLEVVPAMNCCMQVALPTRAIAPWQRG